MAIYIPVKKEPTNEELIKKGLKQLEPKSVGFYKEDLTKVLEFYLERVKRTFKHLPGVNDLTIPNFEFISLQGTTAGRAYYQQNLIKFNYSLMIRNYEEFKKTTCPHELLHIVSFKLFGTNTQPHGKEWQMLMAGCGVKIARCHSYNTSFLKSGLTITRK